MYFSKKTLPSVKHCTVSFQLIQGSNTKRVPRKAGKIKAFWGAAIACFIPTRQANPDFNSFCLGDLSRRDAIRLPLSLTHGVYGLLLSKSYHRYDLLSLFTHSSTSSQSFRILAAVIVKSGPCFRSSSSMACSERSKTG